MERGSILLFLQIWEYLTFLLNIVFEHYSIRAKYRKKGKQKCLLDHYRIWDSHTCSLGTKPHITGNHHLKFPLSLFRLPSLEGRSLVPPWKLVISSFYLPRSIYNHHPYFHPLLPQVALGAEPQMTPQLSSQACLKLAHSLCFIIKLPWVIF